MKNVKNLKNLQSAFNQARSLDIAHTNSWPYTQKPPSSSTSPNIVSTLKLPEESSAALNAIPVYPQTNCICCGKQSHNLIEHLLGKNVRLKMLHILFVEKNDNFPKFCLAGQSIRPTVLQLQRINQVCVLLRSNLTMNHEQH